MKAVILCAGKGARMQHLTEDTPKPLLTYMGKSLIEHKLEALHEHIDEVVLVIGYLGENIRKYFGDVWHGKKIHYVEQRELLGTAHSLFEAKHLLDGPFIVLMGDDLYGKEDLELLSDQEGWAILVEESEKPENEGRNMTKEDGDFKNFVYTGACLLTPEVFELEMTQLPGSKEYGLPQTFAKAAHLRPIKIRHAKSWKRITTPRDLE